jgi:hypothetical protein
MRDSALAAARAFTAELVIMGADSAALGSTASLSSGRDVDDVRDNRRSYGNVVSIDGGASTKRMSTATCH